MLLPQADPPLEFLSFTSYILGSLTMMAKQYGIKMKSYWEHIWEHIENRPNLCCHWKHMRNTTNNNWELGGNKKKGTYETHYWNTRFQKKNSKKIHLNPPPHIFIFVGEDGGTRKASQTS
jgi:hypothetical protein